VNAAAELCSRAGRAFEGGHVALARVLELWAHTIEARPDLVATEAQMALAVLRGARRQGALIKDTIAAYERVSEICAGISGRQ
jgi:hypothetical protein